jgi:hypothetical protein
MRWLLSGMKMSGETETMEITEEDLRTRLRLAYEKGREATEEEIAMILWFFERRDDELQEMERWIPKSFIGRASVERILNEDTQVIIYKVRKNE